MLNKKYDALFIKNSLRIPRKVSSGCTANIIIIYKNYIYCANVGDSRAVLSHNGGAFALSNDHKPSNKKEMLRITQAGGILEISIFYKNRKSN